MSSKNLQIFSWNVNGIRAILKKGQLQELINKFHPDIICLQEIKARPEQVKIDLPDYQEFWYPARRPGYSGTAIFSKNIPLNVVHGFPEDIVDKYQLNSDKYGHPNDEGRVILAKFNDFFLLNIYVPNSKDGLDRLSLRQKSWDPATLDYIKQLEAKKPVIFCGDLNVAHQEIDLARPKDNKRSAGFTDEERQGFNNYMQHNLIDTFRHFHPHTIQYTWWSFRTRARLRNVGWRIDYFLISPQLLPLIQDSTIHDDFIGSDHCPVSITLA